MATLNNNKRSTRRSSRLRDWGPREAGGPAVRDELPPIASRTSTAYGSPHSTRIRHDRRGEVRTLDQMVDQILEDDDQPNSDNDGKALKNPPRPAPPTQPALDQGASSSAKRDPLAFDLGKQKRASQPTPAIDMRANPFLGAPAGPQPRRGSEEPPIVNSRSTPRRGGLRFDSELPAPTSLDTSRSFGTESGVFGSAALPSTAASTPASRVRVDSRPTTIAEDEDEEEDQGEARSSPGSSSDDESDQEPSSRERPVSTYAQLRTVYARPGRNQSEGRNLPNSDDEDETDAVDLARSLAAQPSLLSRHQQREERERDAITATQSSFLSSFDKTVASKTADAFARPAGTGKPTESSRSTKQGPKTKQTTRSSRSESANPPPKSILDGLKPADIAREIELRRTQKKERPWWDRLNKSLGFGLAQTVQSAGVSARRDPVRASPRRSTRRPGIAAYQGTSSYSANVAFAKIRRSLQWLFDRAKSGGSEMLRGMSGISLLVLCLILVVSYLVVRPPPSSLSSGIDWAGFSDFPIYLGQYVPSRLLRPLTFGGPRGDDGANAGKTTWDWSYDINKLKKASKMHDTSLKKLEQILPKVVRMDLDKRGRPVISQEFWHALRDVMKDDGSVAMFDEKSGTYSFVHDKHWTTIKDHLSESGVLESASSTAWNNWLQKNQHLIDKDYGKSTGANTTENGTFLTKSEFINYLKDEFSQHRNIISKEITAVQQELTVKINAVARAREANTLTEAQVREIVREMLAKNGLRAMAKGKIQANWDEKLKHQVNFFTRHTGAAINPKLKSPEYDPRTGSSFPFFGKGSGASPDLPGVAALMPWEGAGECWCGSFSEDRQGRRQGVSLPILLGHRVIPQQIVVEHILPGATLDPAARPKTIEVWANFDELGLRKRIEDFAAVHFPGPEFGNSGEEVVPLRLDGFAKVGQFVYETSDAHGGVHVHQLSDELVKLGAATDQVIVRALSTYGDSDHACFYRVRLYGELRDNE